MENFTFLTKLIFLLCFSNVEVSGLPYFDMTSYCGQAINLSYYGIYQGKIELTTLSSYPRMTCTVTIVASSVQDRIMFYFEDIDMKNSTSCIDDSLQLFDGPNTNFSQISGLNDKICGYSKPGGIYTTTGNTLTLLFTSFSGSLVDSGFDAIFTAYHLGSCNSNEHDCSNGRCIRSSLICSGYNPCGDYSDCRLSVVAIAGIVVCCIAIICLLIVFVIFLRRCRRLLTGNGPYVAVKEKTSTTVFAPPTAYGTAKPEWNPPPPTYFSYSYTKSTSTA
ncbi:hypothetical protein ACJMK2_011235 [Sinanodonta woodiana]|uniref:CUB domain-containing protein n=1 Tax=Sinanodonta woodiana TaxID=1069815 RepID=A0ABD3V494_SINWO